MELPAEIWFDIFSQLHKENHRFLEPLSLVSKQFLALTNFLRTTLSLQNPPTQSLPILFLRFKNLNSIDLSSFRGDPTSIILQIALYYPHLHSLNLSGQRNIPFGAFRQIWRPIKGLKILTLSRLGVLDDDGLFLVADCFPYLEELDIRYPNNSGVTDAGIRALSLKLKNLNRIDISGNLSITDIGVIALSVNCAFLKKIAVRKCCLVTPNSIGSLLKKPELEELLIRGFADGLGGPYMSWAISFELARCLSRLDLSHLFVPDGWLFSIGKGLFPLRSLCLCCSYGFSIKGLVSVLRKHRMIKHLDCEGVKFLTNNDISVLSCFLSELVFVNLNHCTKLTTMVFYYLTRACPLLKIIKMRRINMLEEGGSSMDFEISSQVRSLYLACNNGLSDQHLEKFVKLCPNLRYLSVSYCSKLTEEAVLLVMKRCSEIIHLEINGCTQIKNLGIDFDVPSLEVLQARGAGFNGEALAAIGKRCRNLRHLNLEYCINVSADGLKEVVANCKGLREINVKGCRQLNVDILYWMVLTGPSLRKIIPPRGFEPSKAQRNFFLIHGCLVCQGK